jgi:CRP/FNR family transcriptional regulator, cyclic AMP receptor protein
MEMVSGFFRHASLLFYQLKIDYLSRRRAMASTDEKKEFLKKVPLFHGLKDRQLMRLADRMTERSYKAGDVIVRQGSGGEGFFVIISGKAEAIRERSDGEKAVVNSFGPTDYFGELALLDEEGIRTASIKVVQPVECLVLTRWDFIATLKADAEMAVEILQELARRFRAALNAM